MAANLVRKSSNHVIAGPMPKQITQYHRQRNNLHAILYCKLNTLCHVL